jgi:hypothetical protein
LAGRCLRGYGRCRASQTEAKRRAGRVDSTLLPPSPFPPRRFKMATAVAHLPLPLDTSSNVVAPIECANCTQFSPHSLILLVAHPFSPGGTDTTPLWRRDGEGKSICNACGMSLYTFLFDAAPNPSAKRPLSQIASRRSSRFPYQHPSKHASRICHPHTYCQIFLDTSFESGLTTSPLVTYLFY